MLLKGTARVATQANDGRVIELNVLRKGDCFGEMSILTGAATSNRIEAVEPCTTLAMPRATLQKLLADHPVLSIILYRMLSRRIRASNQRLIQLLSPTLSGELGHLSFIDLVQTVHGARLSGILHIEDKGRSARFGFHDGHLWTGESSGSGIAAQKGEGALDEVIRWRQGIFRFAAGEALPEANMHGDTLHLLLEAVRKMDESSVLDKRETLG